MNFIIAGAGLFLSMLSAMFGFYSGKKREAESKGVLITDIKYIKTGIDELRGEIKTNREQMARIAERLTRVEESTKQAHRRINELKDVHGAD